ncbi:hypothetical protein SAMN06265368_2177 [Cohaesibacter gelatinilyticus]|uniref:Uncharacterized protein n=1 Tax=Cohaesibacter gelatinilyticus TaxID=372072 RepID=A0A285PCD7_9HYPH|nr:hypothetical protein SAMN06265368_2177 [Cohaesibacter gelatinilyticus]
MQIRTVKLEDRTASVNMAAGEGCHGAGMKNGDTLRKHVAVLDLQVFEVAWGLVFQSVDHVHAGCVATAFEFSGQESIDDFQSQTFANDTGAD